MTKEYPFPKDDMLGTVNETSSNAQNAEGLSHEACQTIFEFMEKAKADHLEKEQLIHRVIEDFEHLFSEGNVSKH